jgi:undecaprenyl-diphosphatase
VNFIDAIILGIVEGLTEFLPISSTGHMMLASRLMGIENSDFLASFEISIQLGAILAVVILYWGTLVKEPAVYKKIIAAFIPTAFFGAVFYKLIKQVLLTSTDVVIWSLLLGGLFIIIFDLLHKEKASAVRELKDLRYSQAVVIGICQSVAMIPGVSRAAATIIGGLGVGVSRKAIVEFSFLLAVPTMAAATVWDLYKTAPGFDSRQIFLLTIGFGTSFIVAVAAVKIFLKYIQKHGFIVFGLYRIAIAGLFLILK